MATGCHVEGVFATPDFLSVSEHRELLSNLPVEATEVDAEVLSGLADADSPRGVVTVIRLPRNAQLPAEPEGIWLFLAGVQDPGNVGAIARVAEGAGARGIVLSPECAHPNHPRALRASAGSLLRFPVVRGVTSRQALASPGLGALPWVGLAPRGGESLWSAHLEPPFVVALGAEGPGLPREIEERLTRRLTIPMSPGVESLNVAVAAAVVLFECARRRAPDA